MILFIVFWLTHGAIRADTVADAAVCVFDIEGIVSPEDSRQSEARGFLNCTGDDLVQLQIVQSSMTLNISFHGKHAVCRA